MKIHLFFVCLFFCRDDYQKAVLYIKHTAPHRELQQDKRYWPIPTDPFKVGM